MIWISATMLRDYLQCKYSWHCRRTKVPGLPSIYFILGSAVHQAIEDYSTHLSYEGALRVLQQTLQNDLETHAEKLTWPRGMSPGKLISDGIKMFATYKNEMEYGEKILVEQMFKTEFFTGKHRCILTGKFDRVVQQGDEVHLIDFKTSMWPPSVYEIKGDYQFTLYALAYKHIYGKVPDKLLNGHLRTGEYIEYPRQEKDLNELLEVMDVMIEDLERKDRKLFKNKGTHCTMCQYRHHCYANNRGHS